MNPVNVKYIDTSTSRRQGRNREEPSEGSRIAKLWADLSACNAQAGEQKQHTRPSLRAS